MTVSRLVFCDVMPYGLVNGYRYLRVTFCLHFQGKTVVFWNVTCVLVDGFHHKKNSTLNMEELSRALQPLWTFAAFSKFLNPYTVGRTP
jgi:hypothetical protein